jgi:NAD(P)-dependent dehydrogenase (short-subunit alcohol dehydrogenase family)
MKKSKFTEQTIADQSGKIILITGGNSGIGFHTASVLAGKGAQVIVTVRNSTNGDKTVSQIKEKYPEALISYVILDLANLKSVQNAIDNLLVSVSRIDVLINNAGVMALPHRQLTADGFEMQIGTNHLGHFALTLGLLPLLKASANPRVISLSSVAAFHGKIDFNNLQGDRKYKPMLIYSQSKLATTLFANELARREPSITSIAVHPGIVRTNLLRYVEKGKGAFNFAFKVLGQPVEDGALPSLYAATQEDVHSGMYFGPTGAFNKGGAGPQKMPKRALDEEVAKKLWYLSELLVQGKEE